MHTKHSGPPFKSLIKMGSGKINPPSFSFFFCFINNLNQPPQHSNANELYNFHWLLRPAAARLSTIIITNMSHAAAARGITNHPHKLQQQHQQKKEKSIFILAAATLDSRALTSSVGVQRMARKSTTFLRLARYSRDLLRTTHGIFEDLFARPTPLFVNFSGSLVVVFFADLSSFPLNFGRAMLLLCIVMDIIIVIDKLFFVPTSFFTTPLC